MPARSDNPKGMGLLQNNCLFKNANVTKDKERLRNCSRLKAIKDTTNECSVLLGFGEDSQNLNNSTPRFG